jgi:hypothetical protein
MGDMTSEKPLKKCFVISPIGAEDSESRRRSDQVFNYIIVPAAKDTGYEVTRADKIAESGIINSQIIQRIVEDDLVIADLTDMNANVFYELAIRHSIRRPFVQIMQKGQTIPFDVAGARTIFFDHRDLDSVEDAKKQIVAQIQNAEKSDGPVDSPISVSMDLQILRQSGDPSQRSVGEILDQISEIRREMGTFREEMAHSIMMEREIVSSTRGEIYRFTLHEGLSVLAKMDEAIGQLENNQYSGDFDDRQRGFRESATQNLRILKKEIDSIFDRLRELNSRLRG